MKGFCTQLNDILAIFPHITGFKSENNRATKIEFLATANFLVFHGKIPDRLEALTDEELQTLNTMFMHPPSMDWA